MGSGFIVAGTLGFPRLAGVVTVILLLGDTWGGCRKRRKRGVENPSRGVGGFKWSTGASKDVGTKCGESGGLRGGRTQRSQVHFV